MSRRADPRTHVTRRSVQKLFGARLKQARKAFPAKQQTLAATLRISRTSVSNIERGEHRVFLDQVYLAAKALNVPLADLLPAVSDVFPAEAISSASDSPLSAAQESELARTIDQQRQSLKPKRG